MPQELPNANELLKGNRPAILDELDDFNTADMSSGIMQGILEEQHNVSREATEEKVERTEPKEKPVEDKEPVVDHYAPLNSSIQELSRAQAEREAELRSELSNLRGEMRQQVQRREQPQIDPETPVYYGHLEPMQQRIQQQDAYLYNQAYQNQYNRAQIEFLHFKSANPDFHVTAQELDGAFKKYVGNDVNKALNTNWTGVFQSMYHQAIQPKMQSELTQLRKENEELKKKLERPAQKPNAPQAQPISPALRSSGRTVQTAVGQSDDVINLPSFKRGKSMRSYGKDLQRGGHIK